MISHFPCRGQISNSHNYLEKKTNESIFLTSFMFLLDLGEYITLLQKNLFTLKKDQRSSLIYECLTKWRI